jgi:hypothetical protein
MNNENMKRLGYGISLGFILLTSMAMGFGLCLIVISLLQ